MSKFVTAPFYIKLLDISINGDSRQVSFRYFPFKESTLSTSYSSQHYYASMRVDELFRERNLQLSARDLLYLCMYYTRPFTLNYGYEVYMWQCMDYIIFYV